VQELPKDEVIASQIELSASVSRSINRLRIARLQAKEVTESSTAAAIGFQIELRKAILRHLAIVRSGFMYEVVCKKLRYVPRAASARRRAFRPSRRGRPTIRA
jgi:hypothetical protein